MTRRRGLPDWATSPPSPPSTPELPAWAVRAAYALERLQQRTEPAFASVREALISAFALELEGRPQVSQALADLRQSSDLRRRGNDLDHHSLLIQAAYTQRLARAVLTPLEWQTLVAWHTRRGEPARNRRKLQALYVVLQVVRKESCWCPRPFAAATALEWCSWRQARRTNLEWAEKFDVSPTTVARWRIGEATRGHKPGILRMLDVRLAAAEGALEYPMQGVGLIP